MNVLWGFEAKCVLSGLCISIIGGGCMVWDDIKLVEASWGIAWDVRGLEKLTKLFGSKSLRFLFMFWFSWFCWDIRFAANFTGIIKGRSFARLILCYRGRLPASYNAGVLLILSHAPSGSCTRSLPIKLRNCAGTPGCDEFDLIICEYIWSGCFFALELLSEASSPR